MFKALFRTFRFVWIHPLNVESRIAAVMRVIRWQVASRLMPGPIAIPFVDGTWLFCTRGMAGITGNWYCGLHEQNEMAFVLHALRNGERFVDVGANAGSYAILAGGGVSARVTAVEPLPSTFALLELNVALNRLDDRVCCHQVGLSDSSGTLRFSAELDTENHVLAEGENLPSVEVPVMRLDELVGDDVPTLMKIDVEGHELAVLRGGAKTLGDARLLAVVMETNGSGARYGVTDEALIGLMREFGFHPFQYDSLARRLVEGAQANGNSVFVRNRSLVEERCRSARKFRLVNGEI